jgi:hypothetical protein
MGRKTSFFRGGRGKQHINRISNSRIKTSSRHKNPRSNRSPAGPLRQNPRHRRHPDASRTIGKRERPHGGDAPRPEQGPGHPGRLGRRNEPNPEWPGHCDGEKERQWWSEQQGEPRETGTAWRSAHGKAQHEQRAARGGHSPSEARGGDDGGDGGSGCGWKRPTDRQLRQQMAHEDHREGRTPAASRSRSRAHRSHQDGCRPLERQGGEEALQNRRPHGHDERWSRRVARSPGGRGCTSAKERSRIRNG